MAINFGFFCTVDTPKPAATLPQVNLAPGKLDANACKVAPELAWVYLHCAVME